MAIVVVLRVLAGDLVETVKDQVADVDAEHGAGLADRVGGMVDWKAAAGRAAAATGELMGGALRLGAAGLLVMTLDWIVSGVVDLLGSDVGKPAAAALGELGDAVLVFASTVIGPLIPVLERMIMAVVPVVLALAALAHRLLPVLRPVIKRAVDVLEGLADIAGRITRGVAAIGRAIADAWIAIANAFLGIAHSVDALVAGVAGWFRTLADSIISSIVAPIQEHLNNLSDLWDEWIGRHLDELSAHGTSEGYLWNGQMYYWNEGPLGAQHRAEAGGQVIEHPPSDAELLGALREYARLNGGLSRAMLGPV